MKTDGAQAFINRELSWLQFNRRVLAEAANRDNPALERLKYLSITASNLDEFFMVRFAALAARAAAGDEAEDPAGLSPRAQVDRIIEDARLFVREQTAVLAEHVLPALSAVGLPLRTYPETTPAQKRWAERCFKRDILPKLSLKVHTESQSPKRTQRIAGRLLYLALLILGEKKEDSLLATVQVPAELPRAYRIPKALGDGFLPIEEIIAAFAGQLAPNRRVLGCWPFRVTRDADFTVSGDVKGDLLVVETKRSVRKRKTGDVVRLEIAASAPEEVTDRLCALLPLKTGALYRIEGPLRLTFLLRELYGLDGLDAMRYPPFESAMPKALADGQSVFDALKAGDIFLHHPYDSFDAVLKFVREAADDPRVLAIKQTLYRVSGNSPVIKALCDAAEAGKRVTVLLEVKARFDEENNIHWGELLKRAGCHVIYGLPQLKTHSKITLVDRREGEGIRRYLHLGTGNYNDVTARQYTDMGLFTCDESLGEDAQAFFNMVTGFSREPGMRRLVYAPRALRAFLAKLIEGEIAHALAGQKSGIFAKMNSLVDPEMIELLYAASRAGVPIRLLVRGVCCLRPGVMGLSETIEVRSIVGRFLEHSRVFRFENGGDARLFLSSADWMPRNLNRRVELMFPIDDAQVQSRVNEVLRLQWLDTAKSWAMGPDGVYRRVPGGEAPFNAQEALFRPPAPPRFGGEEGDGA